MKKLFIVLAVAAFASCNNAGEAKTETKDTTTVAPASTDAAPATTAPASTDAAPATTAPASTDAAPATTAK